MAAIVLGFSSGSATGEGEPLHLLVVSNEAGWRTRVFLRQWIGATIFASAFVVLSMDVRVEPTVSGAVFFANRCWVLLRCGVNCAQLVWRQPTALVFLLVDGREKFPVHGRKRKMERNWVDHQSKFKMKRRVP